MKSIVKDKAIPEVRPSNSTCPHCSGSKFLSCPSCLGTLLLGIGPFFCPNCSGTGTIICPVCNGSGVNPDYKEEE